MHAEAVGGGRVYVDAAVRAVHGQNRAGGPCPYAGFHERLAGQSAVYGVTEDHEALVEHEHPYTLRLSIPAL